MNQGSVLWFLAGTLVVAALAFVPVRSALIAGFAMILVVAMAVGVAARTPRPTPPSFTTLEERYRRACDESQHWLEKWGELLAAHTGRLDDTERLLLDEALAGASEAAAEAAFRRTEYASRFLDNGFDRIHHLLADGAEVQPAITVVERYLDTLWIDQQLDRQARARLAQFQPEQRRSQVLELVGSVSLFDVDTDAASPSRVYNDLEAERFRLQAERRLLRELP